MHKKVLIISTSPRRGGNSDSLADAFAQGAREAGHTVEQISLSDKTIGFCKGCLVCQKTQRCVIRDDADSIADTMEGALLLSEEEENTSDGWTWQWAAIFVPVGVVVVAGVVVTIILVKKKRRK